MTYMYQTNRDIILFIYGLVFFELGLAIALQSRTHSRLDLARSLRWMALFGITHGLHEWSYLLVSPRSTYLSTPVYRFLALIQLVLLGLSFTFLFEFGVATLRPLGRARLWHSVSPILFLIWMFVSFFILLPLTPEPETWRSSANALARYFIALPGGLLASFGLYKQARFRIASLGEPGFVRALGTASVALAVYAILAGLVTTPVPFFPGNYINTDVIQRLIGVPPFLLRSIIGLILAVSLIRGLEVFRLEMDRMIETMQQQQILAGERERIARNLHDGTIQKAYTAGLLIESARNLADPSSPLFVRLQRAESALEDVVSDLRRNLSDLRSIPGDEPLQVMLEHIAEDPRFRSLINIELDLELSPDTPLSAMKAEHILAIVKEALSNAIRHARAQTVKISARQEENMLALTISDDGIGLSQNVAPGYGLRNMHDRARLLDGSIEIASRGDKGTQIQLVVPCANELGLEIE